ncbi:hypothetical protein FGG08_004768 [Glutinoglossum americanum]|uniref:Agmatinase n=1 Tax=Glutinoglossum americanum TaxID=1670608 RepID=A0A9P8HZS7_9PEZI|nr:hypothetical protein FGG08_004768 [Glutinoglossum americanum]
MHLHLLPILLLLPLAQPREIVFPPASPVHLQQQQQHHHHLNDEDQFTVQRFRGLTTFANLPYVDCFGGGEEEEGEGEGERYDIAILGAPFDTAVTARPGARYGPQGIRLGSQRIVPEANWDMYTGENSFVDWAKIVDCGDAPLTFLDNTVALKQLDKAHKPDISQEADRMPDTWDPKVLGGGVSHYAGVNHGTFLHLAHEEGLILNSSIHAGIRAPWIRPKGDLRNDLRCGFEIVKARDLDRQGTAGVVKTLKERVGNSNVYISVDIDVLDPAFAPATGTPEVGGWSTRELLTIIDGLEGVKLIGADVVEVAPIYDDAGGITALAAAEIANSLLKLMVKTPVEAAA